MKKWQKCVVAVTCGWLAIVMLSGCDTMSEEEKEQAKQYEEKAVGMIMRYVWEEYHTIGLVEDRHALTVWDDSYLFVSEYATPYVEAQVKTLGKDFYVVCDVETGLCYDNYYAEEMQEELSAYICHQLNVEEPEYIECWFNPEAVEMYHGVKGENYWCEGEEFQPEKVFETGRYEVSILIEDVKEIEFPEEEVIKGLLGQSGHGARITFVDYIEGSAWEDDSLTAEECRDTDFMQAELLANTTSVYSASFAPAYVPTDDAWQDEYLLDVTRRQFQRTTYGDWTFVWDASRCEVEVLPYTPKALRKDDVEYIPVSKLGAIVTANYFGEEDGASNQLYCFYEEPPHGAEYLAFIEGEGAYVDEMRAWTTSDISHSAIPLDGDMTTIKVGIYEEAD